MSSTNVLFHPGSLGPLRCVCTHMQPQCHMSQCESIWTGVLDPKPRTRSPMSHRPGLQQIPPLRPLACQRVKWCDERRDCHPERSEEHTSELQSLAYLVCRLLLEKK